MMKIFQCQGCRRKFPAKRSDQQWCAARECRLKRNRQAFKTWLNKPGKREMKNAYSRDYAKKYVNTKRRS